MDKDTA